MYVFLFVSYTSVKKKNITTLAATPPPLAAGDRCRRLQTPLRARRRPSAQLLESCATRLGPGGVPTATASRSPRLPSDGAPAKTRSADLRTGATQRGWRETAAGQERRGAAGCPSSLHRHSEGIWRAPLPSPDCGHKLLLEHTPGDSLSAFQGGDGGLGCSPISQGKSGARQAPHPSGLLSCLCSTAEWKARRTNPIGVRFQLR